MSLYKNFEFAGHNIKHKLTTCISSLNKLLFRLVKLSHLKLEEMYLTLNLVGRKNAAG